MLDVLDVFVEFGEEEGWYHLGGTPIYVVCISNGGGPFFWQADRIDHDVEPRNVNTPSRSARRDSPTTTTSRR